MKGIQGVEARAKLASRRFSKGITARIAAGRDLVNFIQYNGLVPAGLTFEDPAFAFSMRRSRAFVIPTYSIPELESITKQAGISAIVGAAQDPVTVENFTTNKNQPAGGIHGLESKLRREESLLQFLKQNLVMVYINQQSLPKNLPEILKSMDVLIENTDTVQAVVGEVVLKNATYPNDRKQWN